jgi:formylglycine-generating enzyme required for sulfatase activity
VSEVPAGEFDRLNDPNAGAAISYFHLDTYEVTVGRMRAFVQSGYGTQGHPPAEGAGEHPGIPRSGWNSDWNVYLPRDGAALRSAVGCTSDVPIWTEEPGPNEELPVNCMDWYLSFAFCIWDGSRLPTEAEWNYAAAGGSEQRPYPWGATAPDPSRASYECLGDGVPSPSCTLADFTKVGSFPDGEGLFGNADLGGNVMEWTLDAFGTLPADCHDCANLGEATTRVLRGGSALSGSDLMRTSHRHDGTPHVSPSNVGARCARTPTR